MAEDKVQESSDYDLSHLNQAPDPEPAATATPNQEPAAQEPVAPEPEKQSHPQALRRRALQLGVSPQQIDQTPSDDLFEWVSATERQMERESRESILRDQAENKKPVESELELGVNPENGQPFSEQDLHPALLNALKPLTKKLKDLEKFKADTVQREQVRDSHQEADIVDGAIESLGQGFEKILGKGSVFDFAPESAERKRRLAIYSQAGIKPEDSPRTKAKKIQQAAKDLFGVQAPVDPYLQQDKQKPVPLNEFAEQKGVSPRTVWRWISQGVRGVMLSPTYQGGRVFVTLADFEAFNAAIAKRRAAVIFQPRKTSPEAIEAARRLGYIK